MGHACREETGTGRWILPAGSFEAVGKEGESWRVVT